MGSHGRLADSRAHACAQLLKNLRQSVATLQICGDWAQQGSGQDAVLEMATERVWVQGRASQKRLMALQVWPRTCMRASS